MDRLQVDSTTIKELAHDADSEVLELVFHSGVVYGYFDVPAPAHENLLCAGSMENYFNTEIKDRYRFVKLS